MSSSTPRPFLLLLQVDLVKLDEAKSKQGKDSLFRAYILKYNKYIKYKNIENKLTIKCI